MDIWTVGPLNSHYPKINGIQWDYFNGNQWETLPRAQNKLYVNGHKTLRFLHLLQNTTSITF